MIIPSFSFPSVVLISIVQSLQNAGMAVSPWGAHACCILVPACLYSSDACEEDLHLSPPSHPPVVCPILCPALLWGSLG